MGAGVPDGAAPWHGARAARDVATVARGRATPHARAGAGVARGGRPGGGAGPRGPRDHDPRAGRGRMNLLRVNGSRPVVLVELRRPPRWRALAVLLGLYCWRCGRWWRHALICPRYGRP